MKCVRLNDHGSHMQLKANWMFKNNSMCTSCATVRDHEFFRPETHEDLELDFDLNKVDCCKTQIVIQQLPSCR